MNKQCNIYVLQSLHMVYFGFCIGSIQSEFTRLRRLWVNSIKNPTYKLFDLWEVRSITLLYEKLNADETYNKLVELMKKHKCINKKGTRSLIKLKKHIIDALKNT